MLNTLTTLGTGTIVPVPGRKCAGYLLDTTDSLILLDCGPGIFGQLADLEIDYSKLHNIFITHFHYDHISDLFALIISMNIRFNGNYSLSITGPKGIADILYNVKKFLLPYQDDFNLEKLHITEVEPGNFKIGDLSITTDRTFHTSNSLCYRFVDTRGTVFFYSGDTDYNEHIVKLGSNADLAVVECSHSDGFANTCGHMTWSGVNKFYDQAKPRKLVLSHFYQDFLSEGIHTKAVIGKNIFFANDKDVFQFNV